VNLSSAPIAPSNADKAILPIAGTPSKGVCYVVDWDGGGKDLETEIKKTIKNAKVFRLQVPGRKESELEDFVEDDRLLEAANLLAAKFSPGAPRLAEGAFGQRPKFDALMRRFKQCTNKELQKVDLAYELLTLVAENPGTLLLSKVGSKALAKLGTEILAYFTAQLNPPAVI
jgi:triphosphoribosyl-dephospho-CoA synthetase